MYYTVYYTDIYGLTEVRTHTASWQSEIMQNKQQTGIIEQECEYSLAWWWHIALCIFS